MEKRHTDSEESIELRIANAAKEIEFARSQGKYEYTIINDDLTRAKSEVVSLVNRIIKASQTNA